MKKKAYSAMIAKDKTNDGKVDAIPSRMDLAKRMQDQIPAYTGMVQGIIGMFAGLDKQFAAAVKQHDGEVAKRD